MTDINPFLTNAGVIFQFQTNPSTTIYASSDMDAMFKDIFHKTEDFDNELWLGRKVSFGDKHYKITSLSGDAISHSIADFEPELHAGKPYDYTFRLTITIEEI